jgi:hypothetical protein
MTSYATAFRGGGANIGQDAQAQEWARQQRQQEQQRQQQEQRRLAQLQQQNSGNRPLFQRGQDNDMLYRTGFSGAEHSGYQQRVQMQVGGADMKPLNTKQPSLVNNFGQSVNASNYDKSLFENLNPGGKRAEHDWRALTPDTFTRYQLFYTKTSPYCKNFLHLLCQTPELDKEIQKIDVDELRQNGHRVEGLQGVPTIVDGNALYLGKFALGWLTEKSSNRVQGVDIDDMGYSPIDQSGPATAWAESPLSGGNFSYVFEDSQIQEFDARSLLSPQNATGRGAGSSLDQELQRLQKMREQQIQVDRRGAPQQGQRQQGGYPPQQQGGYPPQQQGGYPPQQQGGYPPQQGGYPPQQQGGYPPQQQGGYPPQQQGGYPPQQQGGYPPQQQGVGYAQQGGRSAGVVVPSYNPNGPNTAAPAGPPGFGGGYPGGQPSRGGYGSSGYPQQQGGGGQQQALPSFLQPQDPRAPGPYSGRR